MSDATGSRAAIMDEVWRLRHAEAEWDADNRNWTCRTCGRRFSAISDHTHINPEPNGWQNPGSDPHLQIIKVPDA